MATQKSTNSHPRPAVTLPAEARVLAAAPNRPSGWEMKKERAPIAFEMAGEHLLRMRGHQMAPAIRDGWFVVVSPGAALAVGEYVSVVLHTGERLVRELLSHGADAIELATVNGRLERTIAVEEIAHIHAVSAIMGPSQLQASRDPRTDWARA